MNKKFWSVVLLIFATTSLLSNIIFGNVGTLYSRVVAIGGGSAILIIFLLMRNIYWWTIPMDIIYSLILISSTYFLPKYEYYQAYAITIVMATVVYMLIHIGLDLYKYPLFKKVENSIFSRKNK